MAGGQAHGVSRGPPGMYDTFYGFREKPFSLLPDPDYLYLSPQHEKALGLLELSLHNQAGFCVISGEIGAGKTTLICSRKPQKISYIRVGLVSNTLDSFGELLNWILLAYDLPGGGTSVEQHERFLDYIIQQYGRGRRTVLIVDEAQNLGVDALEELRMLSNVNADKHQVLQVILVGQSGLRDTLKRPELAQFAQRILMDFHLGPLGREDTAHYIRHRVLVAGANPQLFTDSAAAAVFRYSGGVPRIINLLCDTALVYGYAEGRSSVDAELIHAVARERQSSSAAPALRLAAVAPPAAVRAVEPVPEPDPMSVPGTGVPAVPSPPPVLEPPPVAEAEPQAEPEPQPEPEPQAGAAQTEVGPPVDAAVPSTTMVTEPQGDAEWLRQLADSAVPPSLREAARAGPEVSAPEPPLVAESAPARKPASRPASMARRTGLGRAAGVLLLLTAGVAGYGYFSDEEQDPAQAAETPAVAVPAPAVSSAAEPRPAPPPESPRPEAVVTVPTPEPMAESVRPEAEAPATPPAPTADAPTADAEPEVAAVQEPAAPAPVPAPPKRAAPKPVSRAAPAPVPAPTPAPVPAPEPVASDPPQPALVSKPAAAPVPKPVRVAPEPDPEPLPPAPSVRNESSAERVEALPRPSAVEEDSSTADAAPATAEPQPFTTDPCRGPAARYLSTCR